MCLRHIRVGVRLGRTEVVTDAATERRLCNDAQRTKHTSSPRGPTPKHRLVLVAARSQTQIERRTEAEQRPPTIRPATTTTSGETVSVIVPSDAAVPLRIAFAGTTTQRKSRLLSGIDQALWDLGYAVAQSACEHATKAADFGFPLREQQSLETTVWLLGSIISADAEAVLGVPDVLLARDSCLDPLAHLSAAMQTGHCDVTRERWQQVADLATAYATGYDLVLVLAPTVTQGRDDHDAAIAVELLGLVEAYQVPYIEVDDGPNSVRLAVQFVTAQRPLAQAASAAGIALCP